MFLVCFRFIFVSIFYALLMPNISQFNCFLLMPIVDKLPARLREDLESAFEDDLENVFDITNLQLSLGQQKGDMEIELKRVLHKLHDIAFVMNNFQRW